MRIKIPKIIILFVGYIFLFAILIAVSFTIYFKTSYKEKVLPNVYFYGENISGMKKTEVEKIVSDKENNLGDSIILKYEDKQVNISSLEEIGFVWDRDKTINLLMNIGRGKNILDNLYDQLLSLFYKVNVLFAYDLDKQKAEDFLEELAITINKDPVDGKLDIKNSKAVVFNLSEDGRKLFIKKSLIDLEKALAKGLSEVELTVKTLEAKNSSDIDELGIKELIAIGESDFSGSPANRVHNIKQGAQVFSGALIAPGREFSFITTLGEVSAKTGYLPELVIKEDKTIPEYGGGLCQVSTTFFRAAINAGFPIIERSAHAYRVSYYEPAGLDATIYEPKPDLIFINDSNKHVLIQTRVDGNKLYVDFYGSPDGREVIVYPPVIYNFIQPGEPIRIETEGLKPGEEKQIEAAHVGADTYFTRKIIYPNGETKEDRFDSHYIPWRAKFEVGKPEEDEEESIIELNN